MVQPLAIDFVADVICPWCYLGWVRLGHALAQRPGIQASLRWKPFQLHPDMPREGVEQRAAMRSRYPDGGHRRAMAASLRSEAAEDGVILNMEQISRTPNSLDAHRLIRWSEEAGLQTAVVGAVFRAYFEEARDIGEREVLAEVGQAAGLDGVQTRRRLRSEEDAGALIEEAQAAAHLGVGVVPFVRLDGDVSIIGARPVEMILRALDRRLEAA